MTTEEKIKTLVDKHYPEKETESALYKAKRAIFKKGAEAFSGLPEEKTKPAKSSDKEPMYVYFVSYNFYEGDRLCVGRIEMGLKRPVKTIFEVMDMEKEIEVNYAKKKVVVTNFIQL